MQNSSFALREDEERSHCTRPAPFACEWPACRFQRDNAALSFHTHRRPPVRHRPSPSAKRARRGGGTWPRGRTRTVVWRSIKHLVNGFARRSQFRDSGTLPWISTIFEIDYGRSHKGGPRVHHYPCARSEILTQTLNRTWQWHARALAAPVLTID